MTGFAGKSVSDAVIARAKHGERRAQQALFKEFGGAVYTLALRMTGSVATAEDLLQDTFMEVMRSIGEFRDEASLATWIRRIAVSKCLMHFRSAWQRRMVSFPDLGDGEGAGVLAGREDGGRDQARIDLEKALARLPDQCRIVVWLHDVEGFTHKEIGALLGRTESYSKTRLARAHDRLRAALHHDIALNAASLGRGAPS
jgi:RNA polymerase sigma-70 factor (ECF subfamily)